MGTFTATSCVMTHFEQIPRVVSESYTSHLMEIIIHMAILHVKTCGTPCMEYHACVKLQLNCTVHLSGCWFFTKFLKDGKFLHNALHVVLHNFTL